MAIQYKVSIDVIFWQGVARKRLRQHVDVLVDAAELRLGAALLVAQAPPPCSQYLMLQPFKREPI